MALPVLDKSVCGLTVKTGSLIIGYLSLAHAVLSCIQVTSYSIIILEYPENLINSTRTGNEVNPSESEHQVNLAMSVLISIIIACVVIAVANFLIDIFLVVGIHKKKPAFMLPWIVFSGIGCVFLLSFLGLGAIGLIITLVQAIVAASPSIFFTFLAAMIIYSLLTMFSLYCFLIVYSYYRTTKDQIAATREMQYTKM